MLWFPLSDCTHLAMIGTLTFSVNAYKNLMSEPLENKRAVVAGNNIYLKTKLPRTLLENGKITSFSPLS